MGVRSNIVGGIIGSGGGPTPPYTASAVHFDGTANLTNDALTSTDNGDLSLSGWFNVPDWVLSGSPPTVFVADPVNGYVNYMAGSGVNCASVFAGDNVASGSTLKTAPRLTPGWHNVIVSIKTDLPPSPTNQLWVAASADWSNLVCACKDDYIYTSSDAGATWTKRVASGAHAWANIAVSGDGSIIAAVKSDGEVHISADAGATWNVVTATGATFLNQIAMSSSGAHILASGDDSHLFLSSDSGATFGAIDGGSLNHAGHIFVSPDGTKMYSVTDTLYRSTDSGVSWAEVPIPPVVAYAYGITASADGSKIAIGTNQGPGEIFISTDAGATWATKVPASATTSWWAMASSPGWETLAAVDNAGYVWTSTDLGATWSHGVNGNFYQWVSIAVSSDGQRLAAGATEDGVIAHTSDDVGVNWSYRRVITGTRIVLGYVDDVKAIQSYSDTGPSFDIAMNGLSCLIGQDGYGDNFIGDMADLWIAPGVSLLTGTDIAEATRRLFISAGGKPVDPSGFPASPILFSGNAATFGTNQGTGGAFTLTGSLTNASTSPSD